MYRDCYITSVFTRYWEVYNSILKWLELFNIPQIMLFFAFSAFSTLQILLQFDIIDSTSMLWQYQCPAAMSIIANGLMEDGRKIYKTLEGNEL